MALKSHPHWKKRHEKDIAAGIYGRVHETSCSTSQGRADHPCSRTPTGDQSPEGAQLGSPHQTVCNWMKAAGAGKRAGAETRVVTPEEMAIVLDLFNREVIGWSIKPRMTADLAVDALAMAWFRRRPGPGLLLHSDRGSQGGCNWSSQHLYSRRCLWDDQRGGCIS
jgi:hypothetical protein